MVGWGCTGVTNVSPRWDFQDDILSEDECNERMTSFWTSQRTSSPPIPIAIGTFEGRTFSSFVY